MRKGFDDMLRIPRPEPGTHDRHRLVPRLRRESIYETNRTGTRPVLSSVPESYSVLSNDRTRPIKNRTQLTRHLSNETPFKYVTRRLKSAIRARRWLILSCAAFKKNLSLFRGAAPWLGTADCTDLTDTLSLSTFTKPFHLAVHFTKPFPLPLGTK
jgi:hypothetical protein